MTRPKCASAPEGDGVHLYRIGEDQCAHCGLDFGYGFEEPKMPAVGWDGLPHRGTEKTGRPTTGEAIVRSAMEKHKRKTRMS